MLRDKGHELRRPYSDILEDGIYELRCHCGTVQYRMLYFYHGLIAVITHGFIKPSKKVPAVEIKRAKAYRTRLLADPKKHTYEE